MDTSKITNVLLFKDGFYYLTVKKTFYNEDGSAETVYVQIPDEWNLYDGFEFASDAYRYIIELQGKKNERVN